MARSLPAATADADSWRSRQHRSGCRVVRISPERRIRVAVQRRGERADDHDAVRHPGEHWGPSVRVGWTSRRPWASRQPNQASVSFAI